MDFYGLQQNSVLWLWIFYYYSRWPKNFYEMKFHSAVSFGAAVKPFVGWGGECTNHVLSCSLVAFFLPALRRRLQTFRLTVSGGENSEEEEFYGRFSKQRIINSSDRHRCRLPAAQ
jgi:hypothetical protein